MSYLPDRAFVVQFNSDANPSLERMTGRVEHVESGRRCRFDSLERLVEFMNQMLTPPNVTSQATRQEGANSKGDPEDEDV